MPVPSAKVFSVLHDYDRRLQWDTLLQAAYLTDGWTKAQLKATSVCKGRWVLRGLELKTEYVSFSPPAVAAVRLVNRPPFFESFAATIRHCDLKDGTSQLEYKYNFTARPQFLQWFLHPLMTLVFRSETRRRLLALAAYLAEDQMADSDSPRVAAPLDRVS
jgi:hypothetical protein